MLFALDLSALMLFVLSVVFLAGELFRSRRYDD